MDYEKKYKEVLEKAKTLKEISTNTEVVGYMDALFPELKESEEEQNIKDLIDELKCSLRAANCQNDACGGGHEKRIALLEWSIAWLKKQGKQKSNPYSGISFEYNGHTWGMCARDGGVDIGYDKQLIANINPIREKDEFDNLSKPIDNKDIGCNTVDFMYTAPNHDI